MRQRLQQLPRNTQIALVIAVLVVLWLLSGVLFSGNGGERIAADAQPEPALTAVRARWSEAELRPLLETVRARTEMHRTVAVRSELSGRVAELPLAKGSRVAAGDLLCELAAEDRRERLAEARATEAQAALEYQGAQRLKAGGYQSEVAIAAAKARLEAAQAAVKRAEINLDNTRIRAPFAGLVNDLPVEVGSYMRQGDVCATVVEDNPLLVTGQVTERQLPQLRLGQPAEVRLLNGERVTGTLTFLSRAADERTRTFRIEVAVPNPEQQLAAGITADLQLPVGEVMAHQLSPALLSLDDAGELGIKVVDAEDRVRLYPVTVVADGPAGIWVTGLPARARIITLGQEYVAPGQQVEVRLDGAPNPADAVAAEARP